MPNENPTNVKEVKDLGKASEESILIPKISSGKENLKTPGVEKSKKRKLPKKFLTGIGVVLLLIIIFLTYVGFLFYMVYQKGMVVKASGEKLVAAGKEQNLDNIKTELANTTTALHALKASYGSVLWLKRLPLAGPYVKDGEHAINAGIYALEGGDILVGAIEPYADIIGFSGSSAEQASSGEETAQDRLDFVVRSIPDLIPKSDALVEKVKLIRTEVDQIDPARYPDKFQKREVRKNIKKAKDLIDTGAELIENGKPLLESAPYLMGLDKERRYLILFQNDKELRPTGGFLTAYSIAKVDKGKFEPVSSDDIYNLDSPYTPVLPAPDPVIKYLRGPYILSRRLRLRDLNWSPDFYESMKVFSEESAKVGVRNIDGIIAVDTQLLVNILNVIGPIGVPGFGTYSTEIVKECNCPQVIYELESFADVEGPVVWDPVSGEIVFAPPNIDNRKKIIGPLMNSILSNALGQSKEKIPALFEAGFNSLLEKHVLFYLLDETRQKAAEAFGIAGRITDYEGDYLHINDANLGGRKSNLYVTQEVNQEVSIGKDGSVEKILTITYKNPEKHDGWLNSVLPNWVRVYVPKGSELISFEGVEDKEAPYEELGKTVYAGFFELRPQGVAKVTLKYKLPFKVKDEYKLFVQKQPGKDNPLYTFKVGKKNEELFLKTDKEFSFDIN